MKFEIQKVLNSGRIVKLDDKMYFAAIVDNSEKIICFENFSSYDDAERAIQMVYDVANARPATNETVESFISNCVLQVLKRLNMTFAEYEKNVLDKLPQEK